MKKQMYASGCTLKNRKGFTLIELLAVIVILAIIALIATPIVLNIISDSRESAQLQSAQFYLDAVEQVIAMQKLNDSTFIPDSCQIDIDGNLLCDGKTVEVEVKGEVPNNGTVDFEKGKITEVILMFEDKIIEKQNEELVYLESGLYDENGNLIASWEELVNVYKIDFERDYIDENNNQLSDYEQAPGVILSSDEKLSKGTKLVIDNSVKRLGKVEFYYTNLEEIIIGNGIKSIGDNAFYGCYSLEKIVIGNNVTSIGVLAFSECFNLEEVVLGNSVTNIEEAAFSNCFNLEEVVLPNVLISIDNEAFFHCYNLKEVTIGNNVTSIGKGAFIHCKNLNIINYKGTEEQWISIQKGSDWDYGTPTDKAINYNYVVQ